MNQLTQVHRSCIAGSVHQDHDEDAAARTVENPGIDIRAGQRGEQETVESLSMGVKKTGRCHSPCSKPSTAVPSRGPWRLVLMISLTFGRYNEANERYPKNR
jgi:hypothetical protein